MVPPLFLFPLILSPTNSLYHNKGITDASCPALAHLLFTVHTLEYLESVWTIPHMTLTLLLFRSLSETRIRDAGLKTLYPAVAAHPAIKTLVYGYSGNFLLPSPLRDPGSTTTLASPMPAALP